MSDLYSNVDYISMLYLLFKGELPTKRDKDLLNTLMVGCLNMGPRNVGVRSAMSASMSRTKLHNLLPIGINLSSQQCNIVSEAMKFIKYGFKGNVIDYESVGFKVNTHGRNEYFNSMAEYIVNKYDSDIFLNTKKFIKRENLSWTAESIAAVVFIDLKFDYRLAICLWAYIISPGIIAHSIEASTKNINKLDFTEASNYHIKGLDGKYEEYLDKINE